MLVLQNVRNRTLCKYLQLLQKILRVNICLRGENSFSKFFSRAQTFKKLKTISVYVLAPLILLCSTALSLLQTTAATLTLCCSSNKPKISACLRPFVLFSPLPITFCCKRTTRLVHLSTEDFPNHL